MEWIVIMGLAICIVLYILFINGYAVTQVKRAIMYVESMKRKEHLFLPAPVTHEE